MLQPSSFLSKLKQGLFCSNCKNSEDLDSIFRLHHEGRFTYAEFTLTSLVMSFNLLILQCCIMLTWNSVTSQVKQAWICESSWSAFVQTPHTLQSAQHWDSHLVVCQKMESGARALLWEDWVSAQYQEFWDSPWCLVNIVCLRVKFGAVACPELALFTQVSLPCRRCKWAVLLKSLCLVFVIFCNPSFSECCERLCVTEGKRKGQERKGKVDCNRPLCWVLSVFSVPLLTLRSRGWWGKEHKHFHLAVKNKPVTRVLYLLPF